jgi:NADH-quinone oxidoreductase subunit N
MSITNVDLILASAELWLLAMACAILVVDLFLTDEQRWLTYLLTLASLGGTAIITASVVPAEPMLAFGGMYVADPLAATLKLVAYVAVAVVFVYSRDYLIERGLFKGEFFVLGLTALLGIMVILSGHNLLTLYLGLELLSLSLYAMVAMDRDNASASEAAMKYFVLGAIASGVLLYGMSILYGATGTLDIDVLAERLATDGPTSMGVLLAIAFVVVGLAFKLGAVPMHMWVPDVYHGAPTPVTAFIGTAPKLAGLALFLRLLVEGLGGLHDDWRDQLILLSVLSMAVGAVVAIAQTNMKRLFAYSTIGHVGFILLGILAGTAAGYQAALFYTIAYVLMALAGFGMLLLLSRQGFEADQLEDFKGLNQRSPWFAFIMLCVMFGMAGVPPFLGFYAKLAVLEAILDQGLTWLAVFAVATSIVSAYYYIRIVKLMYFDAVQDHAPLRADLVLRGVLSLNGLAVLALGILPASLMALCARVLA